MLNSPKTSWEILNPLESSELISRYQEHWKYRLCPLDFLFASSKITKISRTVFDIFPSIDRVKNLFGIFPFSTYQVQDLLNIFPFYKYEVQDLLEIFPF